MLAITRRRPPQRRQVSISMEDWASVEMDCGCSSWHREARPLQFVLQARRAIRRVIAQRGVADARQLVGERAHVFVVIACVVGRERTSVSAQPRRVRVVMSWSLFPRSMSGSERRIRYTGHEHQRPILPRSSIWPWRHLPARQRELGRSSAVHDRRTFARVRSVAMLLTRFSRESRSWSSKDWGTWAPSRIRSRERSDRPVPCEGGLSVLEIGSASPRFDSPTAMS